ncbi:hypothetical protein Y032_0014g2508 [Ancylostoma ceylanicum]|nr:hypothetical protein Y032_0014g2508 [Ancylostoma ceylanicum]
MSKEVCTMTNILALPKVTMASSFAPPNIPVLPRNGMIRTYDNQNRTATRPYFAETVFFYKEPDEDFTVSALSLSPDNSAVISEFCDPGLSCSHMAQK